MSAGNFHINRITDSAGSQAEPCCLPGRAESLESPSGHSLVGSVSSLSPDAAQSSKWRQHRSENKRKSGQDRNAWQEKGRFLDRSAIMQWVLIGFTSCQSLTSWESCFSSSKIDLFYFSGDWPLSAASAMARAPPTFTTGPWRATRAEPSSGEA